MLSEKILQMICCPKCHGDLDYDRVKNMLKCTKCGIDYLVDDDIPILIADDQRSGREDESIVR